MVKAKAAPSLDRSDGESGKLHEVVLYLHISA
jgi:hypothetical protein